MPLCHAALFNTPFFKKKTTLFFFLLFPVTRPPCPSFLASSLAPRVDAQCERCHSFTQLPLGPRTEAADSVRRSIHLSLPRLHSLSFPLAGQACLRGEGQRGEDIDLQPVLVRAGSSARPIHLAPVFPRVCSCLLYLGCRHSGSTSGAFASCLFH